MPIDALPPEPNRIEGHEAFVDSANALLAASNTAIAQANALEVNVNAKEASAVAAAANALIHSQSALLHANAAAASANFIGNWSDQAGAASVPCAVLRSGIYWQLLNDIADITASEPGVSSDWQEIYDYKVKDNSSDASPGYLEDKIVKFLYTVKDNAADANPGYLEDKVQQYLSRKNLLINPNFKINQEGYTEGNTLSSAWPADMWFCPSTGNTLKKTSAGESITLDNSAGAATEIVKQWNDDIAAYPDGTTFTFSMSVVSISGGAIYIQGMGVAIDKTGTGFLTGTFTKDTSGSDGWSDVAELRLVVGPGVVVTFEELKLEAADNASAYQAPFISVEELKCRRYLRIIEHEYAALQIPAVWPTGSDFVGFFPLDTPMALVHDVTKTTAFTYRSYSTPQNDRLFSSANINSTYITQTDSVLKFHSVYDNSSGNQPETVGFIEYSDIKIDARPF